MAKKKSDSDVTEKRKQARWKKKEPKNSEQIRGYAFRLEAICRRIHQVADDMDGASILELQAIVQGLETNINGIDDKVKIEFERRLENLVDAKARSDAGNI